MAQDPHKYTYVTVEGILLFPNFFVPKKIGSDKGDPQYSGNLLLPPEGAAPILELCRELYSEFEWKGVRRADGSFGSPEFKDLRKPLQLGKDAKEEAEHKKKDGSFYEGKVVLKARSIHQPTVVHIRDPETPLGAEHERADVWSGTRCHFEIKLHAYNGVDNGTPGIKAYLNNVLILGGGSRIAGRTPGDVFKGIVGKTTGHDPEAVDLDSL